MALSVVACGAQQQVGHVLVVAQAATAGPQITRVTVTIAGVIQQDLAVDPQEPTRFFGAIVVPVGTHTVRADAFAGSTPVGSGSAVVTVTKGVQLQAQIAILDTTGPAPGPDHSPVITSLVAPLALQVDDQSPLSATATDADNDAMTFSWQASPAGCGTFGTPAASSTSFTARFVGACAVTFTATANGKSGSRSAQIQIGPAMGEINVTVQYVPQPVISTISFFDGQSPVATVTRTSPDATIRAAFHKGRPYTVTFSFDAWPTGSATLLDSCGGAIVQPNFVPGVGSATATWTPTVDTGVCNLTARVTRDALADSLFVVVLPVP